MERTRLFRLLCTLAALFLIPALSGCPGEDDPVDPCEGVVCDDPPATHCDGNVVVSYAETGTCEDGECVYPMTRTPCGTGEVCEDGECVPDDPPVQTCEDIEPCHTPPDDHCDDNVAVTYEAEGECIETAAGPVCVYNDDRVPCEADHTCQMADGSPICVPDDVDPTCADIEPCETSPAGSWEENVAINYEADGTCVEEVDGPVCVYTEIETDCTPTETVCQVDGGVASCVDLCAGVDCPARADECVGDARVFYSDAAGTCVWSTGECEYDEADADVQLCGADQTCEMDGDTPICVDVAEIVPCEQACSANEECGRAVDLCVVFEPAEGGFCTRLCENVGDCPEGYACEEIVSIDDTVSGNQCVPEAGYCMTDIVCGIAPPPPTAADTGGYCDHPVCDQDPACEFGYNFDFETWVGDEAPGFYLFHDSLVELSPDDVVLNTGGFSGLVTSTAENQNRDLRPAVPFTALVVGAEYTFHAWFRFQNAPDSTDWVRVMMWLRDADGSLHLEGETGGNYWSLTGDLINGPVEEWTETTVTSPPVEADRVDLRPFFRVRSRNETPTLAWTDDWALTLPYAFTLDAETSDTAGVLVAEEGALFIHAAVNNEGDLYVATNGAGERQDRFLYAWLGGVGTDTVAVPWAKHEDALVAGPADGGQLIALVQDEETGYCAWLRYDTTGAEWEMLSGDDDGTCTNVHQGSLLAGEIGLAGLLGVAPHLIPAHIHFAVAGYGRNDGEGLIAGSQVPATVTDDQIVDPDETVTIHRAEILAGKVH